MSTSPTTVEAYRMLHDGVVALSEIEANGIRINVPYLEQAIKKTKQRIKQLKENLESDKVMQTWRETYGRKTNIFSGTQLGVILFDKLGYECPERTGSGKPKTDGVALERLDIPFVKRYIRLCQLQKANSTFLQGILRETVDGFLHPVFSLHIAATYRSSSEAPNFQNIPVRTPWMKKLIRTAFIPRPGHIFTEIDYKAIEIRVSCCYHKDPRLIEYVCNPELDMHRDIAAECFICKPEQITGSLRYAGKNCFIFPQFYGSYYISCVEAMWEYIKRKETLANGTLLREHLKEQNIHRRGVCNPKEDPRPNTFERHIQNVEDRFWNERFPVYKAWKEKWWDEYQKRGGFRMLTGFVVNGVYRRNEVINSPVQGSAFHCLLWSVIKLQRWIKETRSKAKLIGQIHDSIVADVPEDEFDTFIKAAKRIMTVDIRKAWPWIIVPLEVEIEIVRDGQSWADKKELKL